MAKRTSQDGFLVRTNVGVNFVFFRLHHAWSWQSRTPASPAVLCMTLVLLAAGWQEAARRADDGRSGGRRPAEVDAGIPFQAHGQHRFACSALLSLAELVPQHWRFVLCPAASHHPKVCNLSADNTVAFRHMASSSACPAAPMSPFVCSAAVLMLVCKYSMVRQSESQFSAYPTGICEFCRHTLTCRWQALLGTILAKLLVRIWGKGSGWRSGLGFKVTY